MTLFVVLGTLLVAGALLFVVPPLVRRTAQPGASREAVNAAVYRDQLRELEADLQAGTLAPDQHDKARREIEARLAADLGTNEAQAKSPVSARGAALALGLAVPICALAVYLTVGNPRALTPQPEEGAAPHGMSAQQFETMVGRLAARLKDNPEDAEGWMMLGRSYAVLGRFGDSSEAYAKAVVSSAKPGQSHTAAESVGTGPSLTRAMRTLKSARTRALSYRTRASYDRACHGDHGRPRDGAGPSLTSCGGCAGAAGAPPSRRPSSTRR